MLRMILSCVLLLPMTVLQAETLEGHVVSVVDGDIINVEVATRGYHPVRLAWIDAPARLQDHGYAAAASLQTLAGGKRVRLEGIIEMQGYWQATVWALPSGPSCSGAACPKGTDLGLEQVARGMAWHDQRRLGQPAPEFRQYQQAEFQAKIRRLGLWSGKNPTPPWDWR
ncbi:MAG: thermonuclease family protein [Zoogloeaceae bacterium]|nr:thermonuclease family protein [Zoogloeaceae bacterium]